MGEQLANDLITLVSKTQKKIDKLTATTENLENYISGAILYEETLYQKNR